MTVFAEPPRPARRPRRISSVASLVRVLGSARVSDRLLTRPAHPDRPASFVVLLSTRPYGARSANGAPRTSC